MEGGFVNCHRFTTKHQTQMVILDEMDAIGPDSQIILKKLIDKYSYKCWFCFICSVTEVSVTAKILPCSVAAPISNSFIGL